MRAGFTYGRYALGRRTHGYVVTWRDEGRKRRCYRLGETVEAKARAALIAREGASGTRALMDRFFQAHRVEPRIAMEMPSNETIKQAVMAGLGLSFLSLHTIGLELENGLMAVLPVQHAPVVRQWYVVHPGKKPLSPPAEAFRQFVLAHGAALIGERFGRFVAQTPA